MEWTEKGRNSSGDGEEIVGIERREEGREERKGGGRQGVKKRKR